MPSNAGSQEGSSRQYAPDLTRFDETLPDVASAMHLGDRKVAEASDRTSHTRPLNIALLAWIGSYHSPDRESVP